MTRQRFNDLVKRLEEYSRNHPQQYKLRVGLLAALGYAVVWGALLIVLGLLGGLVTLVVLSPKGVVIKLAIKFGWLLAVLAFIVIRALWVRLEPPAGIYLDRGQVPDLFAMIDDLTVKLGSPRFHHVVLSEEFNAGVMQVPRLGIFGWQANYLVLGLPLLQALSVEQFQAVLAHEFGHLSGGHSRFGSWIYRVRQTWARLIDQLEQTRQGTARLFFAFAKWYGPFFNAYSFVLARAEEYEADSRAARLFGAKTMGDALIQTDVQGRYLSEEYWPAFFKQVNERPEPPPQPYAGLLQAIATGVRKENAAKWLREALLMPTGTADTHPSLTDRLTAIGYLSPASTGVTSHFRKGQMPSAPPVSAAKALLGANLDSLREQLEAAWLESATEYWRHQHDEAQEMKKKLGELDEKAQREALTVEEAWDRARMTADLVGDQEALPLLGKVLEQDPTHAPALYGLGRILVLRDDEAGIAHLEAAMAKDHEATLPACQLIAEFHTRHERPDLAALCDDRADQYAEKQALSQAERSDATDRDRFMPHGLPGDQVAAVCAQLSDQKRVKKAYFVQKVVEHFPEKPFYVLGVVPGIPWYKPTSENASNELLKTILEQVVLPEGTLVIILDSNQAKLRRLLAATEQSLIYSR